MPTKLRRRKHPKSGIERVPKREFPAHRAWVRGFMCLVASQGKNPTACGGKSEAAHVRLHTDGGTGLKPHDRHCVPLCSTHHREQHNIGEDAFEKKYGFRMAICAERLARMSPHRHLWEHN